MTDITNTTIGHTDRWHNNYISRKSSPYDQHPDEQYLHF
ncbi:hypothetical protein ACOMHN_023109 [Nucella lapillus]